MDSIPDRKVPTHEVIYGQIRDMVLTGRLAPGQAVTIQGLIRDLGAGMTPVREAIRRLTAEGALQLHDNRRISVPNLMPSDIDQIGFARLMIEPKLAELAMPNLTPARIARLEAFDHATNNAIDAGDISAYLTANHRFHFALYETANAPVLLDIARSLWLKFAPSLRVVVGRYTRAGMPDRHCEALAVMRAGDGAALARTIKDDIQQGLDHVRLGLAAGEV